MPAVHDTAYPRLRSTITREELRALYTPSHAEIDLAKTVTRGGRARLAFLVLLKTFQRLGYFLQLAEVPHPIVRHIAHAIHSHTAPDALAAYDSSGTRQRHLAVIRAHLQIQPWSRTGRRIVIRALVAAAQTKSDLADLINIALDELVRQRVELPAFSTLHRAALHVRARVHRALYAQIAQTLSPDQRARLATLFAVDPQSRSSSWNAIKQDPGRPTLTTVRALLARLTLLTSYGLDLDAFGTLPLSKLHHFAAEAHTLDVARIQEVEPHKRLALIAALLAVQTAAARDDLATLFIRRMRSIHTAAREALAAYQVEQQPQAETLIATFRDVLLAASTEAPYDQRLAAIDTVIDGRSATLVEHCERQLAYAGNNYLPFLPAAYSPYRATLLTTLQTLTLRATSQDAAIEDAIRFLLAHRQRRGDTLMTVQSEQRDGRMVHTPLLDLSWIPDGWWRLVCGTPTRATYPKRVDRRFFEICVCTQVWWDLQSGDLALSGGDLFADYRRQLISWDAYHAQIAAYGEQVGLPTDGATFVAQLQAQLHATAQATDAAFPRNEALRIEHGEPILSPPSKQAEPPGLKDISALIAKELRPVGILDVLRETDAWLHWTTCFGPISGHDDKLRHPTARYLATTLCYGCLLGPSQTARSLVGVDRRELAWVHHRHVTETQLDTAIRTVINAYNRFLLPKYWGSGKRASADGTQWDLYEQNLLAERHIRYGGYGGLGYYHVSDTYIALFAHFIPCGVWEAVYILDGLLKNESDIQPDTIHADTQGQSETVFGLAYLLGITLMPRIRQWKQLHFYRPTATHTYRHIDELFTATADWELIATHLPDMLRVALSVKAGTIAASTILRRLGTYSRRNKLYTAFRALGRVVRTQFLLTYIADASLRSTIQAATNKSETFNSFIQWVGFGSGGLIPSNDRAEQRKLVKYMHLVANCVIFHNVQALSQILHPLQQTGARVSAEVLAALSPYLTEHINRLGVYTLDLEQEPPPLDYDLLRATPPVSTAAMQHALWPAEQSAGAQQNA